MKPRVLTHADVHLIRISGLPDKYWATKLGKSVKAIRAARVGLTWLEHPTPPDDTPRISGRKTKPREQTDPPSRSPALSSEDRQISRALTRWARGESAA
jgi:hypothetical protein